MADAGSIGGRVLRAAPVTRLWTAHLAAAFDLAPALSPATADLVARQAIDLLAHLLNETAAGGPRLESHRAAAFVNACRVIARRFREPDLTPEAIARDLGVSSRTLARIFAERGETVMRRGCRRTRDGGGEASAIGRMGEPIDHRRRVRVWFQ